MDETFLPNFLIIGGAGRNSGKTTLSCRLIRAFSSQIHVTAIKISPHLHADTGSSAVISKGDGFVIIEEQQKNTGKDSSLFLEAGAAKVFYVQTTDKALSLAWQSLLPFIPEHSAVICEGAKLRKLVKPGLFIFCNIRDIDPVKESAFPFMTLANVVITQHSENMIDRLCYENKTWLIKK